MASKLRHTPRVTFFQRKPRATGNYSVESIFAELRRRLEHRIEAKVVTARFESRGVLRRICVCLEAALRQGDVNHVTGDINYVGIFLRKRATVQTILDCGHLARSSGWRHNLLKLLWVTLPIRNCAYVTTISNANKQQLLHYAPWCDPNKVIVIPVAISGRFQRSDRPFNAERPRILQVGTAENKNLPRLAEALAGVTCKLSIVGRLSSDQRRALAVHRVDYECVSELSEDEMVRQYEKADLVSLVSTYEGFGMPILEAQAVGRPVVTGNILSMPEVAGPAACLVDPTNAREIREGIVRIIRDEQYRHTLVKLGLENVKRYDAATIAEKYLKVYRQLGTDQKDFRPKHEGHG